MTQFENLSKNFNLSKNQEFAVKQGLIYSKIQRNETKNGSSNVKDPSTEIFQLQMPVLHKSKCISKAGPSSPRQVWAEYKDKVPDVSDSIEIFEHHVIPNSNYQFQRFVCQNYRNVTKICKNVCQHRNCKPVEGFIVNQWKISVQIMTFYCLF